MTLIDYKSQVTTSTSLHSMPKFLPRAWIDLFGVGGRSFEPANTPRVSDY